MNQKEADINILVNSLVKCQEKLETMKTKNEWLDQECKYLWRLLDKQQRMMEKNNQTLRAENQGLIIKRKKTLKEIATAQSRLEALGHPDKQ